MERYLELRGAVPGAERCGVWPGALWRGAEPTSICCGAERRCVAGDKCLELCAAVARAERRINACSLEISLSWSLRRGVDRSGRAIPEREASTEQQRSFSWIFEFTAQSHKKGQIYFSTALWER